MKNEEIEELVKEAEAVGDLLNAIETTLLAEVNEKQKKSKSNVIYVDFKLKHEFEVAKKASKALGLKEVLALYHAWAYRTNKLLNLNKGKFNNKKLLELTKHNYAIVETIRNLLPKEE